MKTSVQNLLQEEYASALKNYLIKPGEDGLHRAYAVGRQALAEELGPLEMAMVHHMPWPLFFRTPPESRPSMW